MGSYYNYGCRGGKVGMRAGVLSSNANMIMEGVEFNNLNGKWNAKVTKDGQVFELYGYDDKLDLVRAFVRLISGGVK